MTFCVVSTPAMSQSIRSDNSLSTTVETSDNLNFTIDQGDRAGNNLFHSFSEFSVPTTGSATFSNSADITNIITRITGGSASNIDGLIKANGSANLFLINPSGLIFGPNAQLNIGGSLVGSTAESLHFSDSSEFFAVSATPPSQLTISAPTGLQLGAASQSIQVQGAGHITLSALPLTVFSPSSLGVNSGNAIALIGSDVLLESGSLSAPAGHIELGGVQGGRVTIDLAQKRFDYSAVEQFGNVALLSQSLVNASGAFIPPAGAPLAASSQGGSVQIRGQQLSVQDNSKVVIQNFGNLAFGSIRIGVEEAVELRESGAGNTGIFTNNFGQATGGNIDVSAQQLRLFGDADISTDTFGNGSSGDITIAASESIRIMPDGEPPGFGNIETASYQTGTAGNIKISAQQLALSSKGASSTSESSSIVSQTAGPGSGGNVQVLADSIALTDGGNISAVAFGKGNSGSVVVAANAIEVIGIAPLALLPSLITASAIATGNAGSVNITTQTLRVLDGGRIDSSTVAVGDAGSVIITASERVEVSGTVPGSINPSLIISSANRLDPVLRAFFASLGNPLPEVPTGVSGDVTINTPILAVEAGAKVTVSNDGTGNAGTLTVNADTVFVNSRGEITASTAEGSGGNLSLNLKDVLLLRQGGQISAEAGSEGDGGNIMLNTPVLIALENSDIVANAVQGSGGNIQINTQGILGTEFREQLTAESDITASSQFGVNGTVEITNVQVDPSSSTIALPTETADSSNQIVAGCANTQSSQFIASGRGGLPLAPTQQTTASNPWQDIRDLSMLPSSASAETTPIARHHGHNQAAASETNSFEATAWTIDNLGQVTLVAATADRYSAGNSVCLEKRERRL